MKIKLFDLEPGSYFEHKNEKYLYPFCDPDINANLNGTEFVCVVNLTRTHVIPLHVHTTITKL
jgi:hypothetical protein